MVLQQSVTEKYQYKLKHTSQYFCQSPTLFKTSVCSVSVSMETNTFNQPPSRRLHEGVFEEEQKRKSETDDRKWSTASIHFKDWLEKSHFYIKKDSFNKLRNIYVPLYWFSIFQRCLFLYLRPKKGKRMIYVASNWVRDRVAFET